MPVRLTALGLALVALAAPASAAVLIEGVLDGAPIRIVADAAGRQASVTLGGVRHLVDLETGEIQGPNGRLAAPSVLPSAIYRLDEWSHGPRVAGQRSDYHVLRVDGRICAEVLVGRRVRQRLAPAAQALDLVERAGLAARSPAADGCGVIPFRAFAARGWPLMAGLRDRLAFETRVLRFGYTPGPDEFPAP